MTATQIDPSRVRAGAAGPQRSPAPGGFGWWLAALLYLAFVVYGSLVPLKFQALPWDLALQRFQDMPYLALGIGSRADWVANILLFIPLLFLWAGLCWPQRRRGWRPVVAALLLAGGFALSLAIEFAQLYFPQRTVSLNDVVAETAGAAIGIALWWALGARVSAWLQSLRGTRGAASVAQRLLTVYLLALVGYNLLPLDIAISPVEIYHKWRDGKVVVVPFTTHYADHAQRLYDLLTDIAIWVPAAALWRLGGRLSRLQAWTAVVGVATGIELLQLFVYSRVSDSTDIFTAAIGAWVGVALVRPRQATPTAAGRPAATAGWLLPVLAVLGWLAVLATVFWYPFDFNLDRGFLRDRLAGLRQVPFEAYYFGTEFRAATELLHKLLFFAPLGWLLYRVAARLPAHWPGGAVHAAALLLILAAATTVEAVQVLLPGKNADLTDLLLETLGGAIGYVGSRRLAGRLGHPASRSARHG